MKINSIKIGALVLLGVLVLAGCQKDAEQTENDYTGKRIAVKAQVDESTATRTTLAGFVTEWVVGDRIGVFSPQTAASNYSYTAASSATFSAFNGEMSWGSGAHTFYAYYPHATGSFGHTSVPVSLTASQTQSAGGAASHIGALDFMVAQPLSGIAPGGNVQFQFGHLFTLLEFRVIGSGSISKIELAAQPSARLAFNGGTIDLSQGKPAAGTPYSIAYSDSLNSTVALTLTTPATLTDNDATTPALYMMVNPADLTGQQITVTATIDGEPKTITADGFSLARGRKYTLVVDPKKGTTEQDVLSMIPDPLFLAYCKAQMATWDKNGDGKLSLTEAAAVTLINCGNAYDYTGEKITSLAGIEYFTGLIYLYCNYNKLIDLDVKINTKLNRLHCESNKLTSLDVSRNTILTYLSCGENQLTSLDVSKNIALTQLYCYSNRFTSLDVSKNTMLTALNCYSNQLTSLDVSSNTALTFLSCSENQLTSLDVSKNIALTHLYCYSNRFTSLDVSKNTSLNYLTCNKNPLTSLDISKNTALIHLVCFENQLTSLDVSKNTALTYLNCSNNQLTSLDISKNTALTYFTCHGTPGNGTTFPVKAWFDNSAIPTDFTKVSWNNSGRTISIVYYTGDTPPDPEPEPSPVTLLDSSIDPDSRLVNCTVSAEQYARLINSSGFYSELMAITNTVYAKLNDDFDYIFYVLNTPRNDAIINGLGFYGVNMSVSNAVQGLGGSIFSSSSYWGSAGKLKSVMYLPYDNAIVNGPALHEFAHNWAAFIVPTYDVDNSSMGGHWGLSNAGGQLGGFNELLTVAENSGGVPGKTLYRARYLPKNALPGYIYPYGNFGTFANYGNSVPFSDIELYLMGMKSAQELRNDNFKLDIYSGNSFSSDGEYRLSDGYFWSTTKTSYTIDQIIALNGSRIPDAASSQKTFKLLTVVLTKEGQTEFNYPEIIKGISWFAGGMSDKSYGQFLYNFHQATYGQGTLIANGVKNSVKPQTKGTVHRTVTPPTTTLPHDYRGKIHIDKVDKHLIVPYR